MTRRSKLYFRRKNPYKYYKAGIILPQSAKFGPNGEVWIPGKHYKPITVEDVRGWIKQLEVARLNTFK